MELVQADVKKARMLSDKIVLSLMQRRKRFSEIDGYIGFLEDNLRTAVHNYLISSSVLIAGIQNQELLAGALNEISRLYEAIMPVLRKMDLEMKRHLRGSNELKVNVGQMKMLFETLKNQHDGLKEGFDLLHKEFSGTRDELFALKLGKETAFAQKRSSNVWNSMNSFEKEEFGRCVDKVRRFSAGKKKGLVVFSRLSELCFKSFPGGIAGRKCDDKYIKKILASSGLGKNFG
jgi:hypothetical protein